MPRKKSGKKAAQQFVASLDRIDAFVAEIRNTTPKPSAQAITWTYETALIKIAVAFENLMLDCLVTAINNDTRTISERTGTQFPKHLTDEVCEYLVTGGRYFDFRGRDGLLKTIQQYVASGHWLYKVTAKSTYAKTLDRLFALRNFAAHESRQAKATALKVLGLKQMGTPGSWIKHQQRYTQLSASLRTLGAELESVAPY